MTSPPYFRLRDYKTGVWSGGSANCDHVEHYRPQRDRMGAQYSTRGQSKATHHGATFQYKEICQKCGAIRTDLQVGQETSPQAYINALADVFMATARVLRDDGVLWVNIGDSYANQEYSDEAIKPKDLCGVPWGLAFELRRRGLYLRSAVVWHKLSAVPESIEDRPSTAYEQVFMFTKSAKYYYDNSAVMQPTRSTQSFITMPTNRAAAAGHARASGNELTGVAAINDSVQLRNVWPIASSGFIGSGEHAAVFPETLPTICISASTSERGCCPRCGTCYKRAHKQINGEWTQVGPDTADGWGPGCECKQRPPIPCQVIDPFGGCATTGLAAAKLACHASLIEVSPRWAKLAAKRLLDEDLPVVMAKRERRQYNDN